MRCAADTNFLGQGAFPSRSYALAGSAAGPIAGSTFRAEVWVGCGLGWLSLSSGRFAGVYARLTPVSRWFGWEISRKPSPFLGRSLPDLSLVHTQVRTKYYLYRAESLWPTLSRFAASAAGTAMPFNRKPTRLDKSCTRILPAWRMRLRSRIGENYLPVARC